MAEYIDREAYLSILRAKANMAVLTDGAPYFEKAAQMLEKLPAADVVPVVHGRWLNFDELYALAEQELLSGALEHEEFDAIVNFIDAAPVIESVSVGHRGWISVKERLPEDRDDVLVVAFWAERWGAYMGWCATEEKRWYVNTGSTLGTGMQRVPVAYWMPLPKLPEMDGR